jgi:hypothetical protein
VVEPWERKGRVDLRAADDPDLGDQHLHEGLAGWEVAVADDIAYILLKRSEFVGCWRRRIRVLL